MESSDIHHQQNHHLQDHQLVINASISSPFYGAAGNTLSWTPNPILNTDSFISSYPNGSILNPRQLQQNQNPLFSNMVPEMGLFHWVNPAGNFQSSRIKEEFSDNFNPKFTEILNSESSSSEDFRVNPSPAYNKSNELRDLPLNDLSAKLLLKTFSSGNLVNGQNFSSANLYNSSTTGITGANGIRGFSQIFPSVNISDLNQSATPLENSGNLDMNLQALDLLTASKFNGSFMNLNSPNDFGLYKQGICYGLDQSQKPSRMPLNWPNKRPPLSNGVAEAKRNSNSTTTTTTTTMESKAPKKPRTEPRASCPPFKVRKEKLGDRIAALQQLVAPFGKTDTASVLMEAIGYIKFLQNQVETLSVPYMKSSRNKNNRATKGVPTENHEDEAHKRDLRSRGLCLVPLSYVTDTGSGAVWPTPQFGRAS